LRIDGATNFSHCEVSLAPFIPYGSSITGLIRLIYLVQQDYMYGTDFYVLLRTHMDGDDFLSLFFWTFMVVCLFAEVFILILYWNAYDLIHDVSEAIITGLDFDVI
jgi:hypothetical protein